MQFCGNDQLLSCSDDGSVKLWDITTGKIKHSISTQRESEHLAVSMDGRTAFAAKYNFIYRIDLARGVVTKTFNAQGLQRDLTTSPEANYLYTTDDSVVIRKNAVSGNQEVVHTFPDFCKQLSASKDHIMAVSRKEWRIFNASSFKTVRTGQLETWGGRWIDMTHRQFLVCNRKSVQIGRLDNKPEQEVIISVAKRDPDLLCALLTNDGKYVWIIDEDNNIHKHRVKDSQRIKTIRNKEFTEFSKLSWDPHTSSLWMSSSSAPLRKLSTKTGEAESFIPKVTNRKFLFDQNEHHVVFVEKDNIVVYDKKQQNELNRILLEKGAWISQIELAENGQHVYILDHDEIFRSFDIQTGDLKYELSGERFEETTAFRQSLDGEHLFFNCSFDKKIVQVASITGAVLREIKMPNAFSKLPPIDNADQIMTNVPGAKKINGHWYTESNSSANAGNSVALGNDHLLFHDFFTLNKYSLIQGKSVKRTVWSDFMYSELASSKKFAAVARFEEFFDYENSQDLSQFAIEIRRTDDLSLHHVLIGHSGRVNNMVFSDDGRLLFSSAEDGTIRVWDVDEGRELWSVSFTMSGDYIIATRSGYYLTTPGAFDAVGFLRKGRVLPPASFDLIFHRPDSVLGLLGHADLSTLRAMEKAWSRRVERSGFRTSDLRADDWVVPEMVLTQEIQTVQLTRQLPLNFNAQTEEGLLKSWQVYINGCPQFGSQGKTLADASQLDLSATLILSRGINRIEFECVNDRGFKSVSNPIIVDHQVKDGYSRLHVLTAAVSKYRDSTYDLSYPNKDATDILNTHWEDRFDNVNRMSRQDSTFNKTAFLGDLAKLKETDPDDVVILFLAGHGLLDENFEFYFATYDCDFEDPARYGLSYKELDSMLYLIPSRKVLVMIDACHSGEVDEDLMITDNIATTGSGSLVSVGSQFRGAKVRRSPQVGLRNSIDYMKQLFVSMNYGTGAQVISAASGEGYALESDQWNNGLFTYAFLNALQGNNADLNKNRKIEISELRSFVSQKVEELSNGKQIPTARSVNRGNDFAIY